MKKIVTIAAMAAASFAAPVAPVQAASGDYAAYCYLTPLLSECRGVYSRAAGEASHASASVRADLQAAADRVKWPVPLWWNCRPAAEDAGYMYECD